MQELSHFGFHSYTDKFIMKRLLFMLTALCIGMIIAPTDLLAQEKVDRPFEINISGGGPQWMLGSVGGAKTTYSLMAEIKYTPIKWISIGIIGGMHDSSPNNDSPIEKGEQRIDSKTSIDCNLMLMLYGNWYTGEKIRVYSGIGYGTMGGYVDSYNRPSHGFQFTPVGVSYGSRFYGFAELGMGWMYCPARAGIGFKF